jgi:hypothetical protein
MIVSSIFRGANATIAIIISPFGAFRKRESKMRRLIVSSIFRGANATIAIIVSPFGAFKKKES